jgi:hypothetical protein
MTAAGKEAELLRRAVLIGWQIRQLEPDSRGQILGWLRDVSASGRPHIDDHGNAICNDFALAIPLPLEIRTQPLASNNAPRSKLDLQATLGGDTPLAPFMNRYVRNADG